MVIIIFILLFIPISANAELIDLGVLGETYEIRERDMVDWIKKKAEKVDLNKINKEIEEKVKSYKPKGHNLQKASSQKTHYYNPEVVLNEPLLDHIGKILFPAGHRDNPLNDISLTSTIIYFDAADEKQLNFALNASKKNDKVVLIATDGNISDLMNKTNTQMYFSSDFEIKQLGIERVPSVVYQEGKLIRIDEISLP